MNPLVSILVPIYNGKKFIPDIMDCIVNQTYENIEALFIDDFSTDGSLDILQEYARKDNRIKVYSVKKKGGYAVPTQVQGLKHCKGEYYFYASQDDLFAYDLIEKCVNKSIEKDADIVIPDMVLYYGDKNALKAGNYPPNNDYDFELTSDQAFLLSLDWQIHGFALRRRKLFEVEEFKADYYNSDELYFRKMLLWANKIAFCDTKFYYRQDNPDAITHSVHYFSVDIITTDILLFKTMLTCNYSNQDIKKAYDRILQEWIMYRKIFFKVFKYKLDMKKRIYVEKSLAKSFAYLISVKKYWRKS